MSGTVVDAPWPGGVVVAGGSGGTVAHLEDLDVAVRALRSAAEHLDAASQRCALVRWSLDRAGPWSPGTATVADDALRAVAEGPAGLRALADDVRATADHLERTVGGYRSAEAEAERVLTGGAAVVGQALGEAGPFGWLLGGHLFRSVVLPGAMVSVLLGRQSLTDVSQQVTAGLSGVVVGALPGRRPVTTRPVPTASGVASLVAGVGARPTTVTLTETALTGPERAPRTAAGALAGVGPLYPARSGHPGVVSVQRLDHADGRRSWVVRVPGTQHASVRGGRVPFDMETNLRLVAGRTDDVSQATIAAMREAGVRRGEPVLLAAHSLGGMAAMAVASDATVRQEFTVEAVVTAGSPVAGFDLPDDVVALHLEHEQDHVPSADGGPNPDAPNRTTVRVDLGESPSEAQRRSVGDVVAVHSADMYAATAERVDGLRHPSLDRFERAATRVLGDGTAESTTRAWSVTRATED